MAKWGEGDPRWIVEDRADAVNVNNWHWTEKNASGWSKDRIKQLVLGLKIEGAAGIAEITEVATCEGEASANNRKGKLIFFYEWDIKLNWKGTLNTESMDDVSGTITIPNLSDENSASELDVIVEVKESKAGSPNMKDMLRTHGAELLRDRLNTYLVQLKEEFSQGMILPTDKTTPAPCRITAMQSATPSQLAEDFNQTSLEYSTTKIVNPPTVQDKIGVKIPTKKLSMKEDFMCSVEDLYNALTEKNLVQAFTRGTIVWECERGGRFDLFSGLISGDFQELVPNDKIVQRWRFKGWPEEHYSTVTIKLSQGPTYSTLTLSQTGVPEKEVDRVKEGWSNYYWNSIRQTFGYAVNFNF